MFDQKLICHGPARRGLQKHFCPQKEADVARKDNGEEIKNPKSDPWNIKNDGEKESQSLLNGQWGALAIVCFAFSVQMRCLFVGFTAPTSALHVGFMTGT